MEAYGLFERKYIATPGLNGKREREVGKHDFGGNAAVAARPAMLLGFFLWGQWELKSMLSAWMWL